MLIQEARVDSAFSIQQSAIRMSTTATLVGGTTFLTWLAWQITNRGLGSGVWLILVVPTLASLPQTVAALATKRARLDLRR